LPAYEFPFALSLSKGTRVKLIHDPHGAVA
jgi:hypothetical protein